MLDDIRRSFREAMSRLSRPEDRDALLLMREGLVEARISLRQMTEGLVETRARLAREQAEQATATRRGEMAAGIGDQETARIATEYAERHASRIGVLQRKLAAQEEELALAEAEVAEMTRAFRSATAGIPGSPAVTPEEIRGFDGGSGADSLKRDIDRTAREAEAERRLAELKRKMGR
jgi:hypothetical protein